ncbi:MAG TPA: exodeoxyribonuclease VII large subunit [Steroidobacteraceae bacterium]|nr:exodeoxyribonuclease VII large subunit [Steroidobacteraceae bacterium]
MRKGFSVPTVTSAPPETLSLPFEPSSHPGAADPVPAPSAAIPRERAPEPADGTPPPPRATPEPLPATLDPPLDLPCTTPASPRKSPETEARATGTERVVYSVSRLNREVRLLLDQRLPVLWVEGEISNLSQPSSGHWYFSLKDRDAQVRCAMFRQRNASVDFTPRSGQQVLARGRVSLFEPRGEFQLIVEHLEEAGIGRLQRQLERLKAKLAAEGLFDAALKRALPRFPRRIGVVTSPTGAALRDILHILKRRYPAANVLIYPSLVQGAEAAPSIIAALTLACTRAECDVLIVARGGGSLEDLWAFNDERVARAIRAASIPVISGIGHEIDFTLADFAADARAPTPSGAAELATPERQAVLQALAKTADRLHIACSRGLRALAARVAAADACLKIAHPGARLQQQTQRLDDLEQRLASAIRSHLHRDRHRLSESFAHIVRCSPEQRVRESLGHNAALAARLAHAAERLTSKAQNRLGLARRALDAVSPLKTLERGYAIVTRRADGTVLTQADSVGLDEEIEARLAHGRVRARVTGKSDT